MRYATIFNEYSAQNGDGIDISACKNIVIYKCNVSVGDDGICMKSSSGKNDKGNANLENIIVAGCNVYHAHGGFVIGSNTDGGMHNIFVSDCNFVGTDVGIRVKSNAGRGGLVKDIFINNIFMHDIVNEAILFDTYYEDVPAGTTKTTSTALRDKTPDFRDFHISNVYCNGAKTAISITGLPEMPVHKIYFSNITISAQNGFIATDAADLDLKKVKIITPGDPVYTLNNVKNINISEGYFPASAKVFVKGNSTTSGVNVSATDLRNSSTAIQISK
jgi:polygalacturonase